MKTDNKHITILGAGESGVGAAILAKKQGWEVLVSDFGKIKEDFKEELDRNDLKWEEEKHTESTVLASDLVVKSPGIPETAPLIKKLRAGDLVFATADHGCDPTFPGHDHTRENVPVLAFGPEVLAAPLGARQSFADIGQTVAAHLNLEPLESGISFLSALHH